MGLKRGQYRWTMPLQTRWADNDAYGHLNNATYLSLFDTALTHWQVEAGMLRDDSRFLIVASSCTYHAELAFPDALICGVACAHIGRTSFRLDLGLFKGAEQEAATEASFTQVAVDPESHAKRPLSEDERIALAGIAPASGRARGLS